MTYCNKVFLVDSFRWSLSGSGRGRWAIRQCSSPTKWKLKNILSFDSALFFGLGRYCNFHI